MQEKSFELSEEEQDRIDEVKKKPIPRGQNPEALKKFINDARSRRPHHNLSVNLDWLNWALDYLILTEKEGFTVSEEYLRTPSFNGLTPEPRVIFWDLDLNKPSP